MNRLVLSMALVLANVASFSAETLRIDPSHTAVIFSWGHRGFSHPVARLEKVDGNVVLDRADLTQSSVSVSLALDGLRTGSDALDRRLKGEEFFDVANHPEITFRSTHIDMKGPNALTITGDLAVHGVTKSVALNAVINKIGADSKGQWTAGMDAEVMLRRSEFGVGKYVPMVTDEIKVHITLEASQE